MTWQQSCERGISRVTDTDIRKASTLMIMITIAVISRCFYSASSSSAFPETWMLNYARDWVASDTLTNIPCVLLPLHHNCHHHHAASQYCHRHHIISYDNREGHSFSCHILLDSDTCVINTVVECARWQWIQSLSVIQHILKCYIKCGK